MSKDLISFADLMSGTGGIDTLASAIRKAAAPSDKFVGKNTFKARVLRQLGREGADLNPKDIQNMNGVEAGTENRFTGGGYRGYYVMILEDSPHSFLPNPCAQGDSPKVDDNQLLQSMYTTALYSGPQLYAGDEVMIRMEKKGFSYDTDIAYIVERIGSNQVQASKEMAGCVAPSTAFQGSTTSPSPSPTHLGAPPPSKDPGGCPWSNGRRIRKVIWKAGAAGYKKYDQWDGKEIRNGSLEQTGMLVTNARHNIKGLVPPAMDDFLRLAAAFEAKFNGQKLMVRQGYRDYAGQVNQRLKRNFYNKCGSTPAGKQSSKNAAGQEIGLAADPGTSMHGWGAGIDLNTRAWTPRASTNSEEFKWLNKFSKNYNFVFNVQREAWHLEWVLFGSIVQGLPTAVSTTRWTGDAVLDDPGYQKITLT